MSEVSLSDRTREKRLDTDPPFYFAHHAFCCTNERAEGHPRGSCKRAGGEALRDYMKKRAKQEGLKGVRINAAGCLDRCELGPTLVIYPEGVWYTIHSEADVDEIIERHLKKGERVERLLMPPDVAG